MSLDASGILTALVDHASTLGLFDLVQGYPVINPPASGLSVAYEFGTMVPGAQFSGLAATSVVLTWTASIYKTLQSQPGDDVETSIVGAASALIDGYSGGFTLGGRIREIDLLGMTGGGLSARGGYVKFDEGEYRAVIVTIPMIVNDVYVQVG